jgi:hypothetical protein
MHANTLTYLRTYIFTRKRCTLKQIKILLKTENKEEIDISINTDKSFLYLQYKRVRNKIHH